MTNNGNMEKSRSHDRWNVHLQNGYGGFLILIFITGARCLKVIHSTRFRRKFHEIVLNL